MASSILQLAQEAAALYLPAGVNVDRYAIWIKQGWHRFVHRAGGVFTQTSEVPLTPGLCIYALPDDYRLLKKNGVYRYYAPRAIATAARAANVVTITTATAHNLVSGVTVKIAGTTPVGGTLFDGTFVITVTQPTKFTYAQTAANDTATGGLVSGLNASKAFLTFADEEEIVTAAAWDVTQGAPTRYFFPDGLHIAVNPVPDGNDPVLVLRYDAETPTPIDLTSDLPGPPYLEKALIGYGIWQAALSLAPLGEDQAKAAHLKAVVGMTDFEDGITLWLSAEVERTQLNARDVLEG